MNKPVVLLVFSITALTGCRNESNPKPEIKESAHMTEPTVLKKISISGFDPKGEPQIRVMSDGTLFVLFNFMPPSFADGDEKRFDDFDKQLERAIGVPVVWEDRELFLILQPQEGTIEKVRGFLESYRSKQK
jgi:hypothetical protein